MRLVDVTSWFSDSCGGIKTYYRHKARFLPALGVDCHFVVPGERRVDEPYEGGTLHRLPGPRFLNTPYRLFGSPRALRELVVELRPDVVEVGSHYVLPAMIEHALAGLPRRPRVVGFYHADFPTTYVAPAVRRAPAAVADATVELAWRWVRRVHARYDATLVGSHFIAERLQAHGVPRVAWVGLGVDVETFRPEAGRKASGAAPVAVYAGRLGLEKGFSLVLEAWDAIHAETGASLRIVGDGPLARAARDFAASRPHVTFVGYLDGPAEVAAELGAADVALAPGEHESFSLATAEALACGTPVVGADRAGNAELVARSGGGVRFRAGDAAALARATIDLLERPAEARAALGRAGRAHVAGDLTWQAVCARLVAAYDGAATPTALERVA